MFAPPTRRAAFTNSSKRYGGRPMSPWNCARCLVRCPLHMATTAPSVFKRHREHKPMPAPRQADVTRRGRTRRVSQPAWPGATPSIRYIPTFSGWSSLPSLFSLHAGNCPVPSRTSSRRMIAVPTPQYVRPCQCRIAAQLQHRCPRRPSPPRHTPPRATPPAPLLSQRSATYRYDATRPATVPPSPRLLNA